MKDLAKRSMVNKTGRQSFQYVSEFKVFFTSDTEVNAGVTD